MEMECFMTTVIRNFIVFEGIDGAGTTTQTKILRDMLEKRGQSVWTTNEPTGQEIGKLIRRVLRHEVSVESRTLARLYAADRYEHLYGKGGVIDHTENDEIVISDRYWYSSVAYQGLDIPVEEVMALNDYPHPEAVIFIDPSPETCMERIDSRGEAKEIFEKLETLRSVREGYLRSFRDMPEEVKFIHIPGCLSIEETTEKIIEGLGL